MTCLPLQPDEGRQKARARCLQLASPVRSSTSRVPRSCTGVNVLGRFAGQDRAGARLEAISLFCDAAHGHIADSPYLVNAYVHVRARRREGVICVFDSCTVNSPTTAAPLTSRGVSIRAECGRWTQHLTESFRSRLTQCVGAPRTARTGADRKPGLPVVRAAREPGAEALGAPRARAHLAGPSTRRVRGRSRRNAALGQPARCGADAPGEGRSLGRESETLCRSCACGHIRRFVSLRRRHCPNLAT